MQITIHVVVRSSIEKSFRELVIADLQKSEYYLDIVSEKKVGRANGWAKIISRDNPGVINISWHKPSNTLIVRAITKKTVPNEIISLFIRYLLKRRRRDIRLINILP
jgi:hypothetical protein